MTFNLNVESWHGSVDRFKSHFAFETGEYLLFGTLPCDAKRRSGFVSYRVEKAKFLLEYSHCQYHCHHVGHGDIDYPSGDADVGQCRGVGRLFVAVAVRLCLQVLKLNG